MMCLYSHLFNSYTLYLIAFKFLVGLQEVPFSLVPIHTTPAQNYFLLLFLYYCIYIIIMKKLFYIKKLFYHSLKKNVKLVALAATIMILWSLRSAEHTGCSY